MIGREAELSTLEDALLSALRGDGGVVIRLTAPANGLVPARTATESCRPCGKVPPSVS
jgi:hypothetical protein